MKVLLIILGYLVIGALYGIFSKWFDVIYNTSAYVWYSSVDFKGHCLIYLENVRLGLESYDEDELLVSKIAYKTIGLFTNIKIMLLWPVYLVLGIFKSKYFKEQCDFCKKELRSLISVTYKKH